MRKSIVAIAAFALLVASCSSDGGDNGAGEGGTQPATTVASASVVTVPDAYTAVTVSVIGKPTFPFPGTDGKYHVAYDLELTNTSTKVPATVEKLDVVRATDTNDVIASIEGNQLVDPSCDYGDCARLRTLFAQPASDTMIPPQEGRILFVDYAFPSLDDVPDQVLHHLYVQAAAGPPAQSPTPVDYLTTPYEIRAGQPRVISPPLKGDHWVALNGCCEPGFPHRTSPLPLNGQLINGQRFAIDWKRMNDDGAFYVGDRNDNSSYVDYGADILAVDDATVIATLDGLEPNAPGVLPAEDPAEASKLTVENVDGNHIVLDLGDGTYAFYAHLQAGSLKVKKGDKVKRGDSIAKLGNTGNANASHLHFHLMDGPSVLGSNGLPYVIDSFDYAGAVQPQQIVNADDYLGGTFNQGETPGEPRTDQLPLLLAIVNFPGTDEATS